MSEDYQDVVEGLHRQIDRLEKEQDWVYNTVHRIAFRMKDYIAGTPNIHIMLRDIESFVKKAKP